MHELAIRGARVLCATGLVEAEVGIVAGRIADVGAEVDPALVEIDGSGLLLLPGLVDARVGLREPGPEGAEGFAAGTRAAAHGGVTTVLDGQDDAPLVETRAAAEAKLEAARRGSVVNVGLLGNATRDSAGRLADLADLVLGFELHLAPTGADQGVDSDVTLRVIFQEAARLDRVLVIRCEDRATVRAGMRRFGARGPAFWNRARPPVAEVKACERVIRLAEITGARVHLSPLSTAGAVDLVAEAKSRGLAVSAGTCPHYLIFTDREVTALGALLKVCPAIRGEVDRERLRDGVRDGTIDVLASDHSPRVRADREHGFAAVRPGISSLDVFLPALLHLVQDGVASLEALLERVTTGPARIFGLAGAGRIEPGAAADLVLVAEADRWTPEEREFKSRDRVSPWPGMRFPGRVKQTFTGGKVCFEQ